MKNKITKFKCYFDPDKDIEYINKMNKEGWKLVYIKAGCLYTFVKSEPDEYITILHADQKENIASLAAFAAECGYENIPHTMDGMGDLIYLTGRKCEVSDDFVSDNESKLAVNQIFLKKFRIFTVVYAILVIWLLADTLALYDIFNYYEDYSAYTIGIASFMTVVTLICIFLFGLLIKIKHNIKRKIKNYKQELSIYE